MELKKGDKAPEFALVGSDTKIIKLSDYKGKNLIVLFFPFAFTGVCTEELCSMRDNLADYNAMDTYVVGISVDSPFALAKFKEEQKLNFPLLSDFNRTATRAYGCLYEEFVLGLRGVSKRSAFVVDSNGTIKYAEVLDNAGDLPNFTAIRETIENI